MRLKAEMEAMRAEARSKQKEALKNKNLDEAAYYEGIMIALAWAQDKKNENTFIYWTEPKK